MVLLGGPATGVEERRDGGWNEVKKTYAGVKSQHGLDAAFP